MCVHRAKSGHYITLFIKNNLMSDIEAIRRYLVLNDILNHAELNKKSIYQQSKKFGDDSRSLMALMEYTLKPENFNFQMTESDLRATIKCLFDTGILLVGDAFDGIAGLAPDTRTYPLTFSLRRIKAERDRLYPMVKDDLMSSAMTDNKKLFIKRELLLEITDRDILYGGKPIDFKGKKREQRALKCIMEYPKATVPILDIQKAMDRGNVESGREPQEDRDRVSDCISNINKLLDMAPKTCTIKLDTIGTINGYILLSLVKPRKAKK